MEASLELWLSACLAQEYREHPVQLRTLAHGEKTVVQVQRAAAPDWIARIRPAGDSESGPDHMHALALLLLTLEQHAFPAERVIRTASGALVAQGDQRRLLVTTYLGSSFQTWQPGQAHGAEPGAASQPSVDHALLTAIGALLGQLHTLEISPSSAAHIKSGLNTAQEVAYGLGCLASLRDQVPAHLRDTHAELTARLMQIRRLDHCPHALIHGDCHLGNIVLTADGAPALIDWEAAGWGAALIDLAQLLSVSVAPSDEALDIPALHAVIDGYARHRRLTETERALLPDAIRFRILVTLAGAFARRCDPGYQPGERFWGATYAAWERHEQRALDIARVAVDRLDALYS